MIEVARFGHRQHRAENLFLKDARLGLHVRDYRGRDEVAFAWDRRSPDHYATFALAGFDVFEDGLARARADHRAHVVGGIIRRPDREFSGSLLNFGQELVVDFGIHDRARTSRALLALIAERRSDYSVGRLIEITLAIDDDRVLAAHFGDDTLDPELAGLMPGGQFVDAQTHVARSGERDETGLGMLDQDVADRRAASGDERKAARGEAGSEEHFGEFGGNGRGLARGFYDHHVAGHQRC